MEGETSLQEIARKQQTLSLLDSADSVAGGHKLLNI